MKVILAELVSGTRIVAELIEVKGDNYKIVNPVIYETTAVADDDGTLSEYINFKPSLLNITKKSEFNLNKNNIVMLAEVSTLMAVNYARVVEETSSDISDPIEVKTDKPPLLN